jgi:putative transposase
MSYAIPRPETPSRPENAEEILAERLVEAFGEESDKEAINPGETVLGFFRCVVAVPTKIGTGSGDSAHRAS